MSITEERREAFLDFAQSLTLFAREKDDFEWKLIHAINRGDIPWDRQTPPEVYKDKYESERRPAPCYDTYFISCFIREAWEIIDRMDELDDLIEKEENFTVDRNDFPPDGSYSQAKEASRYRLLTYRWFAGDWNGNYNPNEQ